MTLAPFTDDDIVQQDMKAQADEQISEDKLMI